MQKTPDPTRPLLTTDVSWATALYEVLGQFSPGWRNGTFLPPPYPARRWTQEGLDEWDAELDAIGKAFGYVTTPTDR